MSKRKTIIIIITIIAVVLVFIILLWDSTFIEADTSIQVTETQAQAQINRESRK